MDRSVGSVRQGVNRIAGRFARFARTLPGGRKVCGKLLADRAKRHSSKAFYRGEAPREAAFFSGLAELQHTENRDTGGRPDVDI